VWPAVPGGGPGGALPPHAWKILFKEGGMGTMYPLFYALLQRALRHDAAARQQQHQPPPSPGLAQAQQEVGELQRKVCGCLSAPSRCRLLLALQLASGLILRWRCPRNAHEDPPPPPTILDAAAQAFIDPSDPSTIYLTQPVDEAARLPHQPVYAECYGKDDKPYEPMGLRP